MGGVHIKMPDSVCDSKLLKRQMEENKKIIEKADRKIYEAAKRIKQGDYPKEGLTIFSHIAGLFGQRLWFYKKTAGYTDQLKINEDCTGCGMCAEICPMKNIIMEKENPTQGISVPCVTAVYVIVHKRRSHFWEVKLSCNINLKILPILQKCKIYQGNVS